MNLIAKVELQKPDGSWDQTQQLLVAPGQYAFHEMPISESVNKLRVRFCLETDEIVCGHYSEAAIVDVRPATTRGGIDWQIPVTVVFVLAILIGLVCLACCCCKKAKNLLSMSYSVTTHGPARGRLPPILGDSVALLHNITYQ